MLCIAEYKRGLGMVVHSYNTGSYSGGEGRKIMSSRLDR
jgi:hypothetical protein